MIVSRPFAIASSRHIAMLASSWLGRWWWLMALPLAATAIWIPCDVRAAYLALILLFIAYPFAFSVTWLGHAMHPATLRAVARRQMAFGDDGIAITYLPPDGIRPFQSETIPWSAILTVRIHPSHIVVVTGRRLTARFIIPSDAFSNPDWQRLSARLSSFTPDILQ